MTIDDFIDLYDRCCLLALAVSRHKKIGDKLEHEDDLGIEETVALDKEYIRAEQAMYGAMDVYFKTLHQFIRRNNARNTPQ